MRKLGAVVVLAAALLLVYAAPSDAWTRGWRGHWHPGPRVFIGVGPAFWWGPPYPYWYHPYYPPPYVYAPPAVIVQEPPVYVQQQPVPSPAPPAYWYYCPSATAYYPNVQTCPEAWIKVPPRAP
jgi:hypothetical protein